MEPQAKMEYDNNEVVLCHTFSNDSDAYIAKAALEEEGIMSVLDNEIFSRLYPIGFNSLGGIRLMVNSRNLEQAKAIIKSLKFTE